jgi:hypothetical protein
MSVVTAGPEGGFTVNLSDEKDVDIEIFTVVNGGPGILLQEMKMSTRCREEDGLTLQDTFGHLQLVGYRNTEQGSQQTVATVTISYSATNNNRIRGDLTKAAKNSAITGQEELVAPGTRLTIEAGESETFLETFDLDLAATAGQTLVFSLNIEGVGTVSNAACADQTVFSLTVL